MDFLCSTGVTITKSRGFPEDGDTRRWITNNAKVDAGSGRGGRADGGEEEEERQEAKFRERRNSSGHPALKGR